jgi:amino acid adenylation domain-containing protein
VTHLLHSGFLESARAMTDRPALHVGGQTLRYAELLEQAQEMAATIQRRRAGDAPPLTAVFADRSAFGFSGIIGALLAGNGYVPLNPNFPVARTRRMLQRAGCASLIVDSTAMSQIDDVLSGVSSTLLILLPEHADAAALSSRWPQHSFVAAADRERAASWSDRQGTDDAVAYLLFTSGSTGEPKGVPVTHRNATHLVRTLVDRYGIEPDDRFSQMFDTTFDLSVFDMFVAWQRGACVYCPSRATLLNPDRFIREHALTVWFSVPSVGLLMQRFGVLKPDRYPSLRWSLFCGEPLPVTLAEAWASAASASTLENLYGPTELTVACTAYRWDPVRSPAESYDGIVPIGVPTKGMEARVVDDHLAEVGPGEIGELLMAGPQRATGYWEDAAATARAFVRLAADGRVYYRTGDRVRRFSGDGALTYVGRRDHQIKVLGYRVELGEVEAALRQEPGVHAAVAVGWPLTSTGHGGVAAFVMGAGLDPAAIRSSIRMKLHGPAIPQTIHVLPEFPHNASGKIDRQALLRLLSA